MSDQTSPSWLKNFQRSALLNEKIVFGLIVACAFLLRSATFGNPNLEPDESFYLLVGIKMHDGLLPYVDIWDRKPFGLFIIYYLITFVSEDPAAYQIVATLFAGATAYVVYCFRRGWGGFFGAVFYLCGLNLLYGNGGQAPVFYNLLTAVAGFYVMQNRRIPLAMFLCGLALTIKQTAILESMFFGLWAVWHSNYRLKTFFQSIAIGLAPFAFTALAFWHYQSTFWAAMLEGANWGNGSPITWLIKSAIIIVAALGGLIWARDKLFLAGWLVTAAAGYFLLWNYYPHYLLPFVLPASIAAAQFRFPPAVLAASGVLILQAWPFDRAFHVQSRERFLVMERQLASLPAGPLYISDGPLLLYRDRPMASARIFYQRQPAAAAVTLDGCSNGFLYNERRWLKRGCFKTWRTR